MWLNDCLLYIYQPSVCVAFAEKYVMIMRSHVLRSVLSVLVLHNVFLFYLRVLVLRHVSLMTNDHRLLCVCTLSSHKVAIRFSSAARTMDDYVCINPLHESIA